MEDADVRSDLENIARRTAKAIAQPSENDVCSLLLGHPLTDCSMFESIYLNNGSGSFTFPDGAAGSRKSLRIFYFCPGVITDDTRIVFGMHGLDRKASEFRDVLAAPAEQLGVIVLVPEFDTEAFPDVYAYNYGNVRTGTPDAAILPRELWSFGIIERVFENVRTSLASSQSSFGLFGNSAGSQFVLRYLSLNEAGLVNRAVASNSGIYMLPDFNVEYPNGMGGLGLDQSSLKRYFCRPLTILVGEKDADPTAFDLPRSDEAMAQGLHRLARGRWYFDLCQSLATGLGEELSWRYEIVADAGHVDQRIFDRALSILAE
ncbi:hypothetical protein QA648_24630 (plasmid) [Rhizobium sp. CB3171]|uniref:hypothetical protein n=1 Tax=Rhizobium sp. CB3171 TaxID=3039157 RepID=UPI0024B15D34|nr:hypothetical protein [Rhizobium sp. CB3171]WFU06294.1 hypothetical protein QA648_24630 [Rhizobium sp. CB3171]